MCVCVRVCVRACVRVRALPEQTYADPAALSETTKPKSLLAVDVRQHKGEVLPHLTLVNPGTRHKGERHTHTHAHI